MVLIALRSSLRLWLWRLRRHEARLITAVGHDQIVRARAHLRNDKAKVARRTMQIDARQPPRVPATPARRG